MTPEIVRSTNTSDVDILLSIIHPSQIVSLGEEIEYSNRHKSAVRASKSVLDRYRDQVKKQLDNLGSSLDELLEDSKRTISSINISRGYLSILNFVKDCGGSDSDAISYFKWCLNAHMRFQDKKIVTGFSKKNSNEKVFYREMTKTFNLLVDNYKTPDWFKGNRSQFKELCFDHVLFRVNADIKNGENVVDDNRSPLWIAAIRTDGYPDWLDLKNNIPPDRTIVESELSEDLAEVDRIQNESENRIKQHKELRRIFITRVTKFTDWIDKKINKGMRTVHTLGSFVVLLESDAESGMFGFNKSENEVDKFISEHLKKISKREKVGFIFPELTLLYIVRQIRETGIEFDALSPLSSELKDMFELVFSQNFDDLRKIKERNAKLFKAFNYEIRPLMSDMSQEDTEILKLYLTDHPQMKSLEFLTLLSEIVTRNLEDKSKLVPRLSDFSIKWISQNWRNLYRQLREVVKNNNSVTNPASLVTSETQESFDTREIEESIQEYVSGVLGGWEIYYFLNRNDPLNPKYWARIAGSTSDERIDCLSELFIREGVNNTVRPSTVHGYLEDIVNTPQEVENVRMTQEIGGVRFKKRKKAESTRIFYLVDPVTRRLIFNLYHKEDMSYRKL